MQLCMVGAGMVGGTLGRLWAEAGHDVVLSSRHPDQLVGLATDLGGRAASVAEGLRDAEAVLLAVPLGAVPELAQQHAAALRGRIVMDACNPFPRRDGPAAEEARQTPGGTGCWTASVLDGAKVVKAFNTVFYRTLQASAHRPAPRVGIPLAGDCTASLAIVAQLVQDAGFDPVTVGKLDNSERFDTTSRLWNTGWDAQRLRVELQRQGGGKRLSSVG